jgi:hypothetical protein
MNSRITKYYEDPKTGLKSVGRIYQHFEKEGVRLQDVKDVIDNNEIYQLHKQPKITYTNIIVDEPFKYYQMDLVDMSNYGRKNGGYNWILNMIDMFSKKAYSVALKKKTNEETLRGLKEIIEKNKLEPKQITSDNGGEFTSNMIKKYYKDNDIYHNTTLSYSPNTTGAVERFNRTEKQMIFKYFTLKNTMKWIDVLDDIVENYNNTERRDLGMSPNEVNENNYHEVLENIEEEKYNPSITNDKKFEVEDNVRIKLKLDKFTKKTGIRFSDKIYKIIRRYNGREGLVKDMYKITINDKPLKKKFYYEELQKVENPESLKVDLKEKKTFDKDVKDKKKVVKEGIVNKDEEGDLIFYPSLFDEPKKIDVNEPRKLRERKPVNYKEGRGSGKGAQETNLYGKDTIIIKKSKDKIHKYIAIYNGKKIYFGANGMTDFILSGGDEDRKRRYIKRHEKNEDWNDLSKAGTYSRYILWNQPTLESSIKDFEKRFNVKIKYIE